MSDYNPKTLELKNRWRTGINTAVNRLTTTTTLLLLLQNCDTTATDMATARKKHQRSLRLLILRHHRIDGLRQSQVRGIKHIRVSNRLERRNGTRHIARIARL